jgi:7-dehydrocholesterol reductase
MVELHLRDSHEHMLAETSTTSYRKVGSALAGAGGELRRRKSQLSQLDVNWGRAQEATWSALLSCLGIMVFAPLMVVFYSITLSHYSGSLFDATIAMYTQGPWQFMAQYGPTPSSQAFGVYALWVLFQAALYNYLPAKLSTGQLTPAGHLLQYHTNGLSAWVVTHIAFAASALFGVIDPAWIAKNWSGLIFATNSYGFLLAAFAYAKAYIAPTHARDRKFSGRQYQPSL